MVTIRFIRTFEGREDINLKDKFLRELTGILNWALVGLRRLLLYGHFSYDKTANQIKTLWWQMSDMLGAFMYNKEWVTLGPTETCTKDEFHEAYVGYCTIKNIPAMPKTNIGREMNKRFKETVSTISKMEGDKKIYCWNGVSVKIPEEEPPDYITDTWRELEG